jgi:hypothetical protein
VVLHDTCRACAEKVAIRLAALQSADVSAELMKVGDNLGGTETLGPMNSEEHDSGTLGHWEVMKHILSQTLSIGSKGVEIRITSDPGSVSIGRPGVCDASQEGC